MTFSSYAFILVFLPVVLLGYFALSHVKNSIYQRLFLTAASLFFYGYQSMEYLWLIVVSTAVNYLFGTGVQNGVRCKKRCGKFLFIAGVVFNLLLLGYFKYANFFIGTVNGAVHTSIALKRIVLPLGISFFTFQQLSFLFSVYHGKSGVASFCNYSLFVLFFPKIVSGPLALYEELCPQFNDPARRRFNEDNFASGIYLFAIGLFKKAVVADTIALFADNGFGLADPGLIASWVTAVSYTLQLYFDFSGYSDMALGVARMLNVDLPFNFLSPYKSKSISEFWRRWHITLGRALTTLVYIPLGGNRKGTLRTCINLFLVMLVSGLWHGAAWTFVLWGALNGLVMVFEQIFKKPIEKMPGFIRTAATFLTANFLWVLFRAESFSAAARIYRGMFNIANFGLAQLQTIALDSVLNFPSAVDYLYVFGAITASLVCVFACKNSQYWLEKFSFTKNTLFFAALLLCVSILFLSRQSVFIYFNF